MNLSNENNFEHLVLICFFMALAYVGVAFYVMKRKGFNTKSDKMIIGVALSALPIVALPFWLKSSISWQFKVFVPLVSAIIAVIYYFGIVKLRKFFKR